MVDVHDYDNYPLPFFCTFYYNGGHKEIMDANLISIFKSPANYLLT